MRRFHTSPVFHACARPFRRLLPVMLALLTVLGLPGGASAGAILDAEVSSLRDTAKSLAIAAATKGTGVRGASAYLDSMLRQSDQLICNSWIIAFSISVRRMAVDLGDSPSTEELQAYQAMVKLRDKIVEKCGPITDAETHTALRGGGGTATPDEAEEDETEAPSGSPFVGRKNWNIVDQICWDQCSRQYYAYRRAAREADKRHAGWKKAQKAATDAKKALDAEKADLARLEAEAKAHQSESDRLQDRLRGARGASRSLLVNQLGDELRDRNTAQAAAGRSREAITRLRKAWKKASEDEARAAKLAKSADADATSALGAYQECVKRCYASAQAAGESGAARDTLRDNPNAPYTSKSDRQKMLQRVREMRQQEESRSARETARQAAGSQSLLVRPTGARLLSRLPAPAMRAADHGVEEIRSLEPAGEAQTEEVALAQPREEETMRATPREQRPGRSPAEPANTGAMAPQPTVRSVGLPPSNGPSAGLPASEPTLRSVQLPTGQPTVRSLQVPAGQPTVRALQVPAGQPTVRALQVPAGRVDRAPSESPSAEAGRMIRVAPPTLSIPAGAAGGA